MYKNQSGIAIPEEIWSGSTFLVVNTGTIIPTIVTTIARIPMMNITNLQEHIFFFQFVTPTERKETH